MRADDGPSGMWKRTMIRPVRAWREASLVQATLWTVGIIVLTFALLALVDLNKRRRLRAAGVAEDPLDPRVLGPRPPACASGICYDIDGGQHTRDEYGGRVFRGGHSGGGDSGGGSY